MLENPSLLAFLGCVHLRLIVISPSTDLSSFASNNIDMFSHTEHEWDSRQDHCLACENSLAFPVIYQILTFGSCGLAENQVWNSSEILLLEYY